MEAKYLNKFNEVHEWYRRGFLSTEGRAGWLQMYKEMYESGLDVNHQFTCQWCKRVLVTNPTTHSVFNTTGGICIQCDKLRINQ